MNREKILQTFYEVINESVDWYAEDKDNNTYVNFVNGALAMTNKLLEQTECNYSDSENDTATECKYTDTVPRRNKHTNIIDGDSLAM